MRRHADDRDQANGLQDANDFEGRPKGAAGSWTSHFVLAFGY
jgi:hypothetical protein